jgi:hypothetical protein
MLPWVRGLPNRRRDWLLGDGVSEGEVMASEGGEGVGCFFVGRRCGRCFFVGRRCGVGRCRWEMPLGDVVSEIAAGLIRDRRWPYPRSPLA